MKKLITITLALIMLPLSAAAGLDSKKTAYIGGTLMIKEGTEGISSATDEKAWAFTYKVEKKENRIAIPYEKITSLEYGQKAGRRVAVAILVSPLALLSKKRRHYLTIGFTDDAGKPQAGVFELGKDIVRTMLASIEARSGKKIEYQDDEARKSAKGD